MINQKGALPLLILLPIIGLLVALTILNYAPLKDSVYATLFPKKNSDAADDPMANKQFGAAQPNVADFNSNNKPIPGYTYSFFGENNENRQFVHQLNYCGYPGVYTAPGKVPSGEAACYTLDSAHPEADPVIEPAAKTAIRNYVLSHKGQYWTGPNEPELGEPRPHLTPHQIASLYYQLYKIINVETDPSAHIVFSSLASNWDHANPNFFTKYIPNTVAAYRAIPNKAADKMPEEMPVDAWAFHVYPGGEVCSDTNYPNYVAYTASEINLFIDTVQKAGYSNTPIWLTEWGWIREHETNESLAWPRSGYTTRAITSLCTVRYIKDMVTLFKGGTFRAANTDIKLTKTLDKWFYFGMYVPMANKIADTSVCKYPDQSTCKTYTSGWPDDDYHDFRYDQNLSKWTCYFQEKTSQTQVDASPNQCAHWRCEQDVNPTEHIVISKSGQNCPAGSHRVNAIKKYTREIVNQAVLDWPAFGAWLVNKDGTTSELGKMYACLANNADPNNCPMPTASGTITLSPSTCTISPGQTTCPVTVSWQTSNAPLVSLYEYVSYPANPGTLKSNATSGSYQIALPVGKHAFNLFKTPSASGASDLLNQQWITVNGVGTWSDNKVSADLRNTTVTPTQAQKVQWITESGNFRLTGNVSGAGSVIQADIWSADNRFLSTIRANETTFTNTAPNRFAVILRNQGTGTATFSNVSLQKEIVAAAPTPTPAPVNHPPAGTLDGVYGMQLIGWACDLDTPSTAPYVHLYIDNKFAGVYTANATGEAGLSSVCGGFKDRRYIIEIPESYKDGISHIANTYGIDTAGGTNSWLAPTTTFKLGTLWSSNLVSSTLQNTTVTAAEGQKVQWFTGNDAVGTFKFTGTMSGSTGSLQVDVWKPNNVFGGTYFPNQNTFTNQSPNAFAVILRNGGVGTTTFANVSLVKQQ